MKFYGRPSTIRSQQSLFKKWIKPRFNPLVFPIITEGMLEDAVTFWRAQGLKANTLRSLCAITRKYAAQNGYPIVQTHKIQTNLVNPISASKVLDKAQATKLLDIIGQIGNVDEYLAVCLGYHAGLRKGEVFGLQWSDVDFINKKLMIQRSYDGPTKNGKNRVVPMSNFLFNLLEETHKDYDPKNHEKIVIYRFDPGPILRRACKSANLPEITFHSLRHTFATLALNSGKTIKEVQEMLGHSKASTTIDIYWNHLPSNTQVDFT